MCGLEGRRLPPIPLDIAGLAVIRPPRLLRPLPSVGRPAGVVHTRASSTGDIRLRP